MKGDPTRHDVCQLFEESGCRHAGHVVSWGMEGHASNASNPTTSGLAGSPTTDHHQTSDQALFCAAMIHGHNMGMNFNQQQFPVGALYQILALLGW